MAWQTIHIFTSNAGITYTVQVDFEARAARAFHSPADQPAELTVTAEELGFEEGDLMAAICTGDTGRNKRFKALAILDFPFAEVVVSENDPECFTPPNCTIAFDVNTTNATNNSNNGSLSVVDVLPAGTYQYSLDLVNWQNSPTFNFLFPGNYTAYVRNSEGCTLGQVVTIGNTVVDEPQLPPEIPYQYSNRLCYFFRLIIDGITYPIREPLKWGEINIVGERDPEFHGYNFKYTDGEISLGFDCDAGRELIESVYEDKGQDGEILFQFGYTFENQEYILFPGRLMLNTYKWYAEKVECTVETTDIDTTFTSRLETKVSMAQDESYDGDPVSPPVPYELELHAKQILTTIESRTENKQYESFGFSSPADNIRFIKPDNTDATFTEIENNFQYPLGDQGLDPMEIEEYIVDFATDGQADIEVSLDMDVTIQKNTGGNSDYTAKVLLVYKKYNPLTNAIDTVIKDITTTPVSGNLGAFAQTFNIRGSLSETVEFLKGDQIFCFIQIDMEEIARTKYVLDQDHFEFNITYLETSAATPAKGWFLQDVIRQCINVIGNNRYAMRSTFFELISAIQTYDGCGSKYLLTNGFQIRQFDVNNRPLKIDFRKALRSLNAIFCIGFAYNNDSSGPTVRIERVDYFYQDREILAIEELSAYREEVANDIIYNEIELGYNKYQDSGFNSLDEFNTKSEWLTPIKKNKKKLPQNSDFIASGYSIESIRREQFKDTPSSSVSNDEEPFIIAVKRTDSADFETEKDEAFSTVTGIISPETAYNLRISPKRMLYNWFIWLKGVFAYKESADLIRNTNKIQNRDLVTQFNEEEECLVGDIDRAELAESSDVAMSALATTTNIYRPERVIFTCRLNPQQVQVINLAMTSRYGEGKDRGYIMVKKPTGVWQAVYLTKISYNFATEKAEIEGLKKYSSPAEPNTGDCCPWLVVNGCYLLVNGQKLIA